MKVWTLILLTFLIPDVFCAHPNYVLLIELEHIVGTPQETLEAVQAVFENGDCAFNGKFIDLDVMGKSINPEVFMYLLSKTAETGSSKRGSNILNLINHQLHKAHYNLAPEDAGFRIIKVCLEDLARSNMIILHKEYLANIVDHIIDHGNPDLLRLFLDAKARPSDTILIGLNLPLDKIIPILNCVLDHGLITLDKYGCTLQPLLSLPALRAHCFERYFRCGLPVHYNSFGLNWIEIAVLNKRLDLACVAFRYGVKLQSDDLSQKLLNQLLVGSKFSNAVEELARYIAIQNLFDRIKLLLQATLDPKHALLGLSLATVYAEMFAPELDIETGLVLSLLV